VRIRQCIEDGERSLLKQRKRETRLLEFHERKRIKYVSGPIRAIGKPHGGSLQNKIKRAGTVRLLMAASLGGEGRPKTPRVNHGIVGKLREGKGDTKNLLEQMGAEIIGEIPRDSNRKEVKRMLNYCEL